MEISTIKARLEATQAELRASAAAAREDRLKLRESTLLSHLAQHAQTTKPVCWDWRRYCNRTTTTYGTLKTLQSSGYCQQNLHSLARLRPETCDRAWGARSFSTPAEEAEAEGIDFRVTADTVTSTATVPEGQ